MDYRSARTLACARKWRVLAASSSLVVALGLAMAPVASAATLTNSWQAKLGSGGANGSATINAYTSGTGSIVLRLARLRALTYLPVTLSKGTCASVGTTLIRFPTIHTTSTGAAVRTSSLTVPQATLIKNATKSGRIAIRVGSATTGGVKCAAFVALAVPPYVAARITVGQMPSGVVVAPNGVWVTNWWANSLSRIDPATNTILQTVPLTISGTGGPEAIAYGENSLWVSVTDFDTNGNALAGSVLRIDPTTGSVQATIPVGRGAYDLDAETGAVWVPLYEDNSVLRIDPATNQIVATVPVAGNPTGVASGAGSVWISAIDGHVARIDPATNQSIVTIQTQDTGGFVAFGNNAVWVSNIGHKDLSDGRVTRIDPTTNQVVASVAVGAEPQAVAFAGGSLWVGLYGEATVVRVSGTTNAALSRVSVGYKVYDLAATDHVVWAVHSLPAPDSTSPVPAGYASRIAY